MIRIVCADISGAGESLYRKLYHRASPERKRRAEGLLRQEDRLRCVAADALLKAAGEYKKGELGLSAELEKVLIPNPTNTEDLAAEGVIEDVYSFEILSYEVVPGYSVDNVARIYIEFTNNSDEATSYFLAADEVVLQDGMEIDTALADESVEEEDNYSVEIEPGQSITVARSFELSSDSPVEFMVHDGWEDPQIGTVFDIG